MSDFINNIRIRNFKSIQDLKLDDCKRINLFIGYPNAGKSNVLEALGLFSVPFLSFNKYGEEENLNKLVRAENENELFYKSSGNTFEIETNIGKIKWTDKLTLYIDFFNNVNGVYTFYPNLKTQIANSDIMEKIYFLTLRSFYK